MFEPFPKMARYHREVTVTEKIDGTNAQVIIVSCDEVSEEHHEFIAKSMVVTHNDEEFYIAAGSRTRLITPADDNYGFARWVADNAKTLVELGEGRHYGEWWGQGIQRNYSQTRKIFSLFNTKRWGETRPACCDVVPILYQGVLEPYTVRSSLQAS
jgi:RNA ligase